MPTVLAIRHKENNNKKDLYLNKALLNTGPFLKKIMFRGQAEFR